ncbi:DUF4350 domain-containing protein [Mechercharimyces sp. CAU 1602]|uniref:DUF4350 domain-containing protein n=1 Tax=Mechercharimyces sp. CAU 1602 TaxID=2973933 RepID=UPI002163E11B|nr:DUF4350 domain-containing protein [Mechercharimyces sp. CAU 1602]MCS1351107.1 DUF4350 domain-containing protein [Mechercharimyces sp. CAU 1602]
MKQRRIWFSLALMAAITLLFFIVFLFTPNQVPPYSVHSADGEGTKALYRLLDERESNVEVWGKSFGELPRAHKGNILFLLSPVEFDLTDTTKAQLEEWVKEGNVVVLWSEPEHLLSEQLGFVGISGEEESEVVKVDSGDSPWLSSIQQLQWERNYDVVQTSESVTPVLKMENGKALVGKREMGEGSFYFVPNPDWVTNASIGKKDHLYLPLYFASLVGEKGTLLLDETGHEKGSWGPVKEKPSSTLELITRDGWFVLAAMAVLFLLWLYRQGKRFASPRWEGSKQERLADEYLHALAGLYEKNHLRRDTLEILYQRLLQEVKNGLFIREQVESREMMAIVRTQIGSEMAERLEAIQLELQQEQRLKRKDMLSLQKEMEQLREEIQQWRNKQWMHKESLNKAKSS